GAGYIKIIDRDFVEPSNLQRQTLFDESDALNVLPKAVAAERKLRSINSSVAVEGVVADLGPRNAEALLDGVDLLLDGTDNFETRFLINDVAVKSGRPWIYPATPRPFTGVCSLATFGPATCNPSAWRAIRSAALAPGAISPILQEKSSPVLPCAVATPFRFTNAPGHSTLAFSTPD